MILNIFFGIGVSIVNTRFLGPQIYGEYKLISSIFLFLTTFTNFGYYFSTSRLVAKSDNIQIKRNIISGSLTVSFIISIFNIILLLFFSFYINHIFNAQLSIALRVCLPLILILQLKLCLENIFQGDNKIKHLSILRTSPQLLYLVFAFIIGYFSGLNLISALLLQLVLSFIVVAGLISNLNPEFSGIRKAFNILNKENKSYGIHVYTGALSNVGAAQLFSMLIGYFVDPTSVGFYSLAVTVCGPIRMCAGVFGTTFFKKFSSSSSISNKVLISAFCVSLAIITVFFLLVGKVIILFYSEKYSPAINLSYIICFGFMLHGFGDIFNRFLGAHGKGKEIRNGAIATGLVSLCAGILLTMSFGVVGTAIATSLTGIFYFSMMVWFYSKRNTHK